MGTKKAFQHILLLLTTFLLIFSSLGTYSSPNKADAETVNPRSSYISASVNSDINNDSYILISNESIDAESFESTGSFNIQEQTINIVKDEALEQGAYRIDVDFSLDVPSPKDYQINKNKRFIAPTYKVGQTRNFWVTHLAYDYDYQINARLAYSGSKAYVWVHEAQITDTDAEKLGKEFDNKIYSIVTNNFAKESDVDGDGKINILVYDIQDGFDGYYNMGYVEGYFHARDLLNVSKSNQSEIFYIDSYPSMGMEDGKDVTKVFGTLAHEFQHMVSFNQNVLIEGKSDLPTWIDEGLAEAANQIYRGKGLSDRIDYFNASGNITNGHSLLYWGDRNDVLSNYALSYLFMQYVKIQSGQGDKIFKEIHQDPNNNYKAIENVAKKYIDSNMTFGQLMTNFRLALFLNEPTGLYGFKGDPFFNNLEKKIYFGTKPLNLRGGGAIITPNKSSTEPTVPSNKGANVTYTFISSIDEGKLDVSSPTTPTVNLDTNNKRIAGASRYHTATTISQHGWAKGSTDTVIIARGDSFPDALAGATLAYEKNAPILLTGDSLHQTTKDEIKRLGAKNAIVLGGTVAVPNKVVNELKGLGLKVDRVAGSGRYETAVKIANKLENKADTAILAYGLDFPDALSIAPYAAKNGFPILLTEKGKLSKATKEYLAKNKNIKNIIIVGGTSVISNNVQNQLKGYKVERIAGQHRFDTAAKIVNKFGNPSKAYIANGSSFSDALTGSLLAAKEGVPLLLVEKDKIPYATQNVIKKKKINKFTFLGGEAVISEKVKKQLLK